MSNNSMMYMGAAFVITFAVLFFAKPQFVVSNETMGMSRDNQKPCLMKVTLYSLLVALVVGLVCMMLGGNKKMINFYRRKMRFF